MFGLMLWGRNSQIQDPVSSTSTTESTGPQIVNKAVGSPANVLAVVNGLTVTISWDSVALADAYHVVIAFNNNPYLNVKQVVRQIVVRSFSLEHAV